MTIQPQRNKIKPHKKKKTILINRVAPTNKNKGDIKKTPKKRVYKNGKKNEHAEYGTSKLELRFAKSFLDKLNIRYIYQFKMGSIGRFLDFYLPDHNIAIEVDGDYWHSYGIIYEKMTPTQKKNNRVDKEKNHWCLMNGIPLIRIWEHDINKHPKKVLELLKERLYIGKLEKEKKDKMKQRH